MYRKQGFKTLAIIVLAGLLTVSCSKQSSRTTGWAYNDANNGGFEVTEVNDQEIGPGLIAIEGGTFVMGATTDKRVHLLAEPRLRPKLSSGGTQCRPRHLGLA